MVLNRSSRVTFLLFLSGFFLPGAFAAEIDYELGYGGRYESNLLLDETTKDSGFINSLNLAFSASEFDSTWIDGNVNYTAEITRPLGSARDLLEDEELIEGDSRVEFIVLPKHLSFQVLHYVDRVLEDARSVDIANNRDLRNFLSVGPDLEFTPSAADTLGLFLRYARIFVAGEDPRGAERFQSQASWVHELSSISSFSVVAEYEETEQQQTREAFLLGYSSRLRTLEYGIFVGVNSLETLVTVDGQEVPADESEPNIRINLNKEFTSSSLEFTLFKELSDTLFGVSGLVADTFVPTEANIEVFDIVDRERIALELSSDDAAPTRFQYTGTIFYESQDFINLSRDQKSYGLELNLSYAVIRNGNVYVDYHFSEIEFGADVLLLQAARDDTRNEFELGLQMKFGGSAFLRLYALLDNRESTEAGEEHENIVVGTELTYEF